MSKPPKQLELIFTAIERVSRRIARSSFRQTKTVARAREVKPVKDNTAHTLQKMARAKLYKLGMHQLADKITVAWQPRLQSTAGRATYYLNHIELNPRLQALGTDEVHRTLWHEVAHLLAHARNRRRSIRPHGIEWQQACADLGIPDESVTHHLPLPSRNVARPLVYICPGCKEEIHRVRKFKRVSACYPCCKIHNKGYYDERFRLKLIKKPNPKVHS